MCVGVVYDRIHSREIASYGGLAERMPAYASVFMLFMLASVGLPGTSGFVGEILVIIGVFQINSWVAALAATGMILGAAYMLWLYRRVIFGALLQAPLRTIRDLRPHEIAAFAPLALLVLLMGIYPALFLDPMAASVDHLLTQVPGQPAPGDRGHAREPLRAGRGWPCRCSISRPRPPRSFSPAWRWRC